MEDLEIQIIPALKDNYIYLLHDKITKETLSIDPGDANPVLEALISNKYNLTHILNTHHHYDHTEGNVNLYLKTRCQVIGPKSNYKIPYISREVSEGNIIKFGKYQINVLEVPGHTMDHIIFWISEKNLLFTGDALFHIGCGRVFEGTFEQMWKSLCKMRSLPAPTKVYCAHEYSYTNSLFALTLDPNNKMLQNRSRYISKLIAQNKPSVPFLLGDEIMINPFLKVDDDTFRQKIEMGKHSAIETLKHIRLKRNNFC